MRFYFFVGYILSCSSVFAQTDSLKFVTADVDAFWSAYDTFKKDTTVNVFEAYLAKGTAGVQALQEYAIRDATQFKKNIQNNLSYYDQVRSSSYAMMNHREKIINYFVAFKKLYPAAELPPIYFSIGQMNVGGTSSNDGIIICMEKFSDQTVTNNIGWQTISLDRFPIVVLNALMFYNQKPAHTGYTLLRQCIVHGAADFLTALVLGDEAHLILNQKSYLYGNQHEELLVREFLREQNESNLDNWFYQSDPTSERPSDVGFWIGYKITESYYNNAVDKQKALEDIMKINDFERFLVLSGYTDMFRK